MLMMPLAALPARADGYAGPSALFWADRQISSTDNTETYEVWLLTAYRSSGPMSVAAQSQLDQYLLVYEVVTFNYESDSYNGTFIAWGTLSPELLTTTETVDAPPPLPAARFGSAGVFAPLQDPSSYTFYGDSMARTSGAGALVVKPDGISHNGDPEERATFALQGYQPNTLSSAVAVGTFACSSGPTVFNAGLYLQITGKVYSFSYDGSNYQVSPTGLTQTHKVTISGSTYYYGIYWQMIGNYYVFGDAYPGYTNSLTYYFLGYGIPWAIAEY